MSLLLRTLAWLVAGLCAAVAAGYWQAEDNEARLTLRFNALARRAVEQVAARMHSYEYGLRGARGAVIAAGGVDGITRVRFAQYSASRNIELEFQGARGFGFIRRVPAAEEAAFVQARRLDGKPDYGVTRLGTNPGERYVVQYIEPAGTNDVAIGLDIASEPVRKAAADAAMLSGEATLTAPITLVLPDSVSMRSMLLLLPVLKTDAPAATMAERFRGPISPALARSETVGWVYTALVVDEVLKGFDFQDGEFSMVLSDVTRPDKPERFFASPGRVPADANMRSVLLPLQLFGRAWQVEVTAQRPFYALLNLRSPWTVASGVAMLAVLFSLLSYGQELTRRRKEQAGEERSRLAAIVTSSNDAIIGRRLDATITNWNAAAAQIFGYTSAEAVGHTLHGRLVPPDHAVEEQELMAHIAAGRSVAAFETFRRRRDGTLVTVSVAAAPIRSAAGRVIGAAQTVRDITHENASKARILELNATLEQQVADRTAELRTLSARERAVLAGAGIAIIATDAEGIVVLFNPAAEALLGYAASEVVGRLTMNHFHDARELHAREQALAATLGRTLEPGEFFVRAPAIGSANAGEWIYKRKDGARIPVHLDVSALRDADGRLTGFIAIAADLSERRRAEQKTRDDERFMRIVTDNIPGIVAYWTLDMHCTFANNAYRRWLGRTPEEMIGTTQLALLGPEQFARNEPYIRAALAGREQRVERSRTIADGSTVHYWLHYIPDRDDDGVVKGFISVTVDVTEMKQAQTQLEALNLALNERSRQAESASKAKSEFLANMSHEIRSPLNAVIGLTYLLRQTALDAGQQSLLEKIEASSNALLGVINDILDISKIEAGQMALEQSEFELPALLEHVTSMMAVNAGRKGLALEVDAEPGLPQRLRGDVVRVRQILINLLSNAIKFTEAGSVQLHLQQRGRVAERLWLRFAVVDTGIGIEAEVLGRLFTPFTQADMSTTRRFGGTGLGLSIVKQMTELMGGQYGVSSTPGVGSEFWVVLPLDVVAVDAKEAGGSAAAARDLPLPAASGSRLAGIRVLVVDDSPVNLQVCRHILEREGARVSVAEDGREAVDTLRRAPRGFDVVLMDVHMPNLDGNEATERIRQELGLATLPIVALTASALVAERDRVLAAGMNDFISKPFEPEALIRCVRRHGERASGHAAGEPTAGAAVVPAIGVGRARALPASWPRIEGIDATDAFERLGGDAELLRSVLRRLLAEFGELAGEDAASAAGRGRLVQRLHKLRGSAGMVGATAVGALAGEGEEALAAGAGARAEGAMQALGAALRSLQHAARAFVDAGAADDGLADAASAVDAEAPGPAPEDRALLVEALRRQNMGALSLFDELAPGLRAALPSERFAALERAVQDLRFREAADLLQDAEAG